MDEKYHLDSALAQFQEITQQPENFLNFDHSFSKRIKTNLKNHYNVIKLEDFLTSNALSDLLITDFETEQIWQQIEIQNDVFLTQSIASVSKILSNKNHLTFNVPLENINDDFQDEGNETLKEESNVESDQTSSDEEDYKNNRDLLEVDQLSGKEDVEIEQDDELISDQYINKNKKSIVDDEFFKLDEMENFLRTVENEFDSQNEKKTEDSDSVDGSIDLFKADSDEEEDQKFKTAKFKDFFISKMEERPLKKNKFLGEISSDNEEELKSNFECRQERLQKKIEELEENAIADKPWTLQGEISASSRPQNSLLEEVVEFDLTSRPAPVITKNITHQLEDIIKRRIKDKHFNSVERKLKPVETLLEYKKRLVLDQEKSKHSLAQIYENEFLEQQASLNPEHSESGKEEPEIHKEIKSMMSDLFNKLDALSNFHFTPKPAIPELKIVTNLPAVVMEEVAPINASDASLLAPEEIRNKPRGDIIGKSERTRTDKKRERRKKKLKQKLHIKQTINKNLLKGSTNKNQVFKGKPMQKMKENFNKSLKSSSAFFTQLQEQVQSNNKGIKIVQPAKTNNKKLSAKKLKL